MRKSNCKRSFDITNDLASKSMIEVRQRNHHLIAICELMGFRVLCSDKCNFAAISNFMLPIVRSFYFKKKVIAY